MTSHNVSRIERLAKEGSWIVVGQIATVLGTLMLVRVLTAHLGPTQYGHLALGLTVAVLVNQLMMGGLTNAIGRFYTIAAEKQDLDNYLRDARLLMVYSTLVVVLIGLVLMAGLGWLGYSQWMGLAVAVLVFSVLSGYNSTLSSIQNAARQRAVVALHSALDAWLKILLVSGMVLWFGNISTVVVAGYIFSSLFITISQFFFLRRLTANPIVCAGNDNQWAQRMLAYSWPFSVWGIFTWLQQVSDRWALEIFATTADVGLYSALFQLGYAPITIATGMAMSFLGPILYSRSGDASDQSRNANVHQLASRLLVSCLLLTLIAFLLTLGLHDWMFSVLVAPEFRTVSHLLPWMVVAGGLFATGQMLALKLMSDMKPATMTRAKIITALLGVLFNFYGASAAGIQGLVGAMIAFSIIFLAWMTWLAFYTVPETKI